MKSMKNPEGAATVELNPVYWRNIAGRKALTCKGCGKKTSAYVIWDGVTGSYGTDDLNLCEACYEKARPRRKELLRKQQEVAA